MKYKFYFRTELNFLEVVTFSSNFINQSVNFKRKIKHSSVCYGLPFWKLLKSICPGTISQLISNHCRKYIQCYLEIELIFDGNSGELISMETKNLLPAIKPQ